jgi:preprotein translocase subunit SecG
VIYVLYAVHVIISIFLILVVLLQRGKGADLSVFGGGATQAAFGARGQASLLHKLTVICFVGFILTTLSIGLFEARSRPSVMGGVAGAPAEEAPAPASAPPEAVPAAVEPPATTEGDAPATGQEGAATPESTPPAATSEPVPPPQEGAGS